MNEQALPRAMCALTDPWAWLNSTVAFVWVKLGAATTADRGFLLGHLRGWSPKPSNRDYPPHFRELHALDPQQHVA